MRFSKRGDSARLAILTRAIEVAAAEGFDAVTFDRLSRDLGRSKSGIFELFQSKERLRTEVIGWAAELFQRRVVLPGRAISGASGLRFMLDRWLDHVVSDEGLVLAIAALTEWDADEYRPFERLGWSQKEAIDGCILFGVKFGHIRADVDQHELALDLFVLGAGSAAALMALGEGVREQLKARIDVRFADILTPKGAEVVAAELAAIEAMP